MQGDGWALAPEESLGVIRSQGLAVWLPVSPSVRHPTVPEPVSQAGGGSRRPDPAGWPARPSRCGPRGQRAQWPEAGGRQTRGGGLGTWPGPDTGGLASIGEESGFLLCPVSLGGEPGAQAGRRRRPVGDPVPGERCARGCHPRSLQNLARPNVLVRPFQDDSVAPHHLSLFPSLFF